ncbi:putative cytochrome P450 oxidoreductase, partial [Ilyonectria destructans]
IAAVLLLIVKLSRVGMRPKGYPPGPPTLPIIGNLHQFPRKDLHLQFQKWTEEYGPVVSLQLGTQTLILLGTATAVSDLLEKKSSIYSTRMDIMFREFGNELNIAFRPYDDVWRRQRKIYHVRLNAKLANNYLPYQNFETYQLLHDFLESPHEYRHHLERFTISIGSTIAFGRRISSADDPVVKWFRNTIDAGSSLQVADWWPILRPLIRAVPSVINPIKTQLNALHNAESELWRGLVELTREHVKDGHFYPSRCSVIYSHASEKDQLTEEEIWYNSGHSWAAATDTQSNTLIGFVKAMIVHPEIQARVRKEVDEIVGTNRLPEWSDRAKMPYTRRVQEETLRWAPTTLTGGPMPHAVSKDDIYMGYKIPAGAGVMNCVWTINNDENRFANPRDFNPLRYSEEDSAVEGFAVTTNYEKRPHNTFGAGRRICPGSHVAERTLFITMSRLIWAFEFHPKKDQFGIPKPIGRDDMLPGLVAGPKPF